MRDEIFPAISENKGYHSHQQLQSAQKVDEPWEDSGRKGYLPSNGHHTAATPYSEPWGSLGYGGKNGILAPESWGMYQRNDFTEPRLLHLPMHRKGLTSLTWNIWFSLIIFNAQINAQITCPLLQNFFITWLLPSSPWGSSLRVTWDAVSRAWSPKKSHQIKHNSQLLGCKY